jgi:P4 family phage/plasmid primase-like protien
MGQAPRFEMAFLLFGQAGSGKSVLQSIMKGLVPFGSSASIAPTDWGDRFLPAELFGKIINFAGELSESRPIPGDIFKKIISGEDLTVQFKNGQPFSFEPEAAHWFNSNFLPKTRDSSDGFNRRWMILEFNNRVNPSKKITDLDAQILEHEREAIVAWAIQGYKRLMDTGKFTTPTSCLALVESMAADNNTVRHFLTSPGTALKWGAEHQISLPDMHTQYWQFMLATGSSNRANITKFTKLMKELSGAMPFQVDIRGHNELYYLGVGV